MFISEESEAIFTKGERDGSQDRIDPKYFLEVRSSQGKTMWPLQNRWDRRANAAPKVPSLMPPAKRKATSTSEKDEENTEEESRKAPFSVFSTETTVAVPYKRPPEMPPPIVTPVKAEAIQTVYKSPPRELRLSLPQAKGVPEANPEGEVPRADPVPFKGPPKGLPPSLAPGYASQGAPAAVPAGTALGVLSEGSSGVIEPSAKSIEPGGSITQSTPVAVPLRATSVTFQASSGSLPGVVKAHSPPPPPPFPVFPQAKLPDGAKLPPVGRGAPEEELNKRGTWLVESAPNSQGIIRPRPAGADQDFREL
jgi:hypothetical protein